MLVENPIFFKYLFGILERHYWRFTQKIYDIGLCRYSPLLIITLHCTADHLLSPNFYPTAVGLFHFLSQTPLLALVLGTDTTYISTLKTFVLITYLIF